MSEQQNTQQPVAYRWRFGSESLDTRWHYSDVPLVPYSDRTVESLYTAPPVPRDVLMAALTEINSRYMEVCGAQFGGEYISAIADRYASQVQPETVNQQLLAALKDCIDDSRELLEEYEKTHTAKSFLLAQQRKVVANGEAAIAAAEAAQPVGVCQAVSVTDERAAFEAWAKENCCAAGGINFKRFDVGGGDEIYDDPSVETSYQAYLAGARQQPASTQPTDEAVAWMTQGTDGPIFYTVKPVNGLERFTPLYPASAQPVAVPDGWQLVPKEPTHVMKKAGVEIEIGDEERIVVTTFDEVREIYRAMLSAAKKPEGV